MALTRRDFLVAPLCATLLAGCGAGLTNTGPTHYAELAAVAPKKPNPQTIVVFMPETPQTRDVWKGLSDELGSEYHLVAVRVERAGDAAVIAEGIRRHSPVGLVLMNNPTVSAYRDYQAKANRREFPPALIVMTSFLEGQMRNLVGSTGISYEVPLISVMTNLRRLITLKSERVGVVVRSPLRGFVNGQVALAQREQVAVIQEIVSPDPNPSEVKRAIRRLKQHADVLWILNDDRLLEPKLISEGWLPGLDERPWVPTIVGAGSLVSSARSFGTFAVLPDHVALGTQAASMLLDIADAGWKVDAQSTLQLPLSTTTIMDALQVNQRFVMRKDALQQVDRVLD